MTLTQGSIVKITCPEKKFPAFARGFQGKLARVSGASGTDLIPDTKVSVMLQVEILDSKKHPTGQVILVQRQWLSARLS